MTNVIQYDIGILLVEVVEHLKEISKLETRQRFSHIDLLESIAIFFVITYHSTLYFYDITQDNAVLNYILYYGRTILSTCVPLFFFANGYLLFNQKFELRKHIKKIIRLLILILIWAIIRMPLMLVFSGEPIRIKTIVFNILELRTDYKTNHFWFLGALICIYILFPALKALFDLNKKGFIFFTVACAILTFGFVLGNQVIVFARAVFNVSIPDLNYPFITMFNPFRGSYGYSFVYFCVGGLIFTYEDKILSISKVKRNTISVIGIILSCFILFLVGVFYSKFLNGELWDVVWNGYDTVFTFFNTIFIYLLCLNYTKNYWLIRNVSKNTLGIYFVHAILIHATRPWIQTQDFLCNLPINIVYAILILFICLLLCIIIRKIPIIKKLI